ncbi:unnamed protein product, partial [Litomosoides sigmodontis]
MQIPIQGYTLFSTNTNQSRHKETPIPCIQFLSSSHEDSTVKTKKENSTYGKINSKYFFARGLSWRQTIYWFRCPKRFAPLDDWLVGWLDGWMAGWLVGCVLQLAGYVCPRPRPRFSLSFTVLDILTDNVYLLYIHTRVHTKKSVSNYYIQMVSTHSQYLTDYNSPVMPTEGKKWRAAERRVKLMRENLDFSGHLYVEKLPNYQEQYVIRNVNGWLVGWVGWLGWLVGWVGWLGWLVGWLV